MNEKLFDVLLKRVKVVGTLAIRYDVSAKVYQVYKETTWDKLFEGSKKELKEWLLK